jgi:[ribosomal protein S18]-alanine N-acetyltransferase
LCDAVLVRQGGADDLERVAEIQNRSSEAAGWNVSDYLGYDFRVVERRGRVLGFSVARRVAADESELLNLAVDPGHRREGLGAALLRDLCERLQGTVYLEVRESNTAAREFYQVLGFKEVSRRSEYYRNPPESAVVMSLRSCYCHS